MPKSMEPKMNRCGGCLNFNCWPSKSPCSNCSRAWKNKKDDNRCTPDDLEKMAMKYLG